MLKTAFATLALAGVLTAAPAPAAVLVVGVPVTTTPTALIDPLSSLAGGLASNAFLVPVLALGAASLDSWSFDLVFDTTVAAPFDVGGLYQSVYQADFGGGQPSEITSSGVLTPGLLSDISGYFAPPVTGDGPIAYVLLAYLPGQEGHDPGLSVHGQTPTSPVPEPTTPALAAIAGVGMAALRRWTRRPASRSTL